MKSNIWLLPLADVSLNLGLVFMFLLSLSVAAVNSKNSSSNTPKTGTLFKVKMTWTTDSRDDMDLYVADPENHLVYFKRLSDGLMNLERDDTGAQSNSLVLEDGSTVTSAFNEEVVDIRGIVTGKGQYIANVHLYHKFSETPTKVDVALYKVASADSIPVHETVVTLERQGDEKTAFRFTILKSGDIVDINDLPKKFTSQ